MPTSVTASRISLRGNLNVLFFLIEYSCKCYLFLKVEWQLVLNFCMSLWTRLRGRMASISAFYLEHVVLQSQHIKLLTWQVSHCHIWGCDIGIAEDKVVWDITPCWHVNSFWCLGSNVHFLPHLFWIHSSQSTHCLMLCNLCSWKKWYRCFVLSWASLDIPVNWVMCHQLSYPYFVSVPFLSLLWRDLHCFGLIARQLFLCSLLHCTIHPK